MNKKLILSLFTIISGNFALAHDGFTTNPYADIEIISVAKVVPNATPGNRYITLYNNYGTTNPSYLSFYSVELISVYGSCNVDHGDVYFYDSLLINNGQSVECENGRFRTTQSSGFLEFSSGWGLIKAIQFGSPAGSKSDKITVNAREVRAWN